MAEYDEVAEFCLQNFCEQNIRLFFKRLSLFSTVLNFEQTITYCYKSR